MQVAPCTRGAVCILRFLETKHLWPGGQPPDHGSSVSTPEECASANPPTKMKNTVFPRSMSRRRPSHRSFRSTVAHCQGGFFNLRALLGLTLVFPWTGAWNIRGKGKFAAPRVGTPPLYARARWQFTRRSCWSGTVGTILARSFDLSDRPVRSRMAASRRGSTCTDDERRPSGTTSEA